MVASPGNVLQGVRHGSSATGHGQSCHATLKGGHTILKHTLCGIGQAAIYIAGIAQAEAVGGVLRVAEHVAGGLIYRYGACVGCGVGLFLAYVQLQCLKAIVLLAHSLVLSFYC